MKHVKAPNITTSEGVSGVLDRAFNFVFLDQETDDQDSAALSHDTEPLILSPSWRVASLPQAAQFSSVKSRAGDLDGPRHGALDDALGLNLTVSEQGDHRDNLFSQTGPTVSEPPRHNHPSEAQMIGIEAVPDFVLKGWMPKRPEISRKMQITCLGTCFAATTRRWLQDHDYNVSHGFPNPSNGDSFGVREFLEAVFQTDRRGDDLGGYSDTKRIFNETDVFIISFSASEIAAENEGDGATRNSPSQHFIQSGENLQVIYDLVREHCPNAKIIFSLAANASRDEIRDKSYFTSDAASKAILRAAIEETMHQNGGDGWLYYWPSFEILTKVFNFPNLRAPHQASVELTDYLAILFEQLWCEGAPMSRTSLREAWIKANIATGVLPESLRHPLTKRRPNLIRRIARSDVFSADPAVDVAIKELLKDLRAEWQDAKRHARKRI